MAIQVEKIPFLFYFFEKICFTLSINQLCDKFYSVLKNITTETVKTPMTSLSR